MLRVDRQKKKLELVHSKKLVEAGYRECEDIQELIVQNPDTFFGEIGEPFLLIGKEVQPYKPLGDSIDLLAIDQEGRAVIFELKRGKDKHQLLQSITYAAMISKWKGEQFSEARGHFAQKPLDDAAQEVEAFLANYITNLNKEQRVILIAEDFDPSVIVTAEWLTEQYDLQIECFELTLSRDGEVEFLSCSRLYPPIELMQFAGSWGGIGEATSNWPNWDTALAGVSNTAVRQFFAAQLQKNQENRLRQRQLIWRIKGVRRFYVSARPQYAYVWQPRRFQDDTERWKSNLDVNSNVQPVDDGRAVRFYLRTSHDFQEFLKAVTVDLIKTEFYDPSEDTGPEPEYND